MAVCRAFLLLGILAIAFSLSDVRSASARLTPDSTDIDTEGAQAIEDASVPGLFADLTLTEILAITRGTEDEDAPPWNHFRRAHDAIEGGNRSVAIDALREVLDDPETGVGVALWTWANLRRLGIEPPADIAEQVRGVVFELPVRNGIEYVSAYADGRWRYIHARGGGLFWEHSEDPDTTTFTDPILAAGQRLMPWAPPVRDRAVDRPGAIRLTLLTFGGFHQVTLSEPLFRPAAPTRPVLTALIDGMVRLMKHITDIARERN